MSIEKYDYEIVNGRKIRVRPRETVSEIDVNGYFRRQPNHFTTPFGDGENDLKAEGNQRYRLIWAKLCHWSNRASIVRELEGLEDQISVNMVSQAHHEKNLGWEYVYNENNVDPVLGDQFLSEAYYRADEDYQGRTTVPALIDTKTGKVVNNDYNWLTNYLEVNFRPWHKKGAPELYPVELRDEIDKMNLWEIPAFKNNTFFADFAVPPVNVEGSAQRSFNYRFLKQIDFAKYWGESVDRSSLSKDPANKLKAETDAGTARSDTDVINNQEDAIIYEKIHAIPSTEIAKYTEEELPTRKDPSKLPTLADTREEEYQAIIEEIGNLPDEPDLSPVANKKQAAEVSDFVKANITDAVSEMLNAVDLEKYIESAHRFYGVLEQLEADLGESRFLAGDFVTQADVALYVSLVRFDILYSRYFGTVKYRIQDLKNVSEYLKDLYQIPAFAHNTDFNAIIKQGQADLEQKLFRPSTHYDRVIPEIDLDAQWKVPTERAYLSEDPAHPIYLSNNRRFDLDPTWYELGAESLTKVEEAPQCGCACSLGSK